MAPGALYGRLFLALGIVFCFLVPPFQAPDEPAHYLAGLRNARGGTLCSAEVSLLHRLSAPGMAFKVDKHLPAGIYSGLPEHDSACDHSKLDYGFPFAYPFVVAAKNLMRGEDTRPIFALAAFFLSRLFAGLFLSYLLFRYCRAAGKSKVPTTATLFLPAVCVIPLFVQQSFAVTSDTFPLAMGITLAGAVAFPIETNGIDLALVAFAGILGAATKPTYLPLLFGGLLLITWRARIAGAAWTKSRRTRNVAWGIAAVALVGVVLQLFMFTPLRQGNSGTGAAPLEQLIYILKHPFHVTALFLKDSWRYLDWGTLLKTDLGWLDHRSKLAYPFHALVLIFVLLFCATTDLRQWKFRAPKRLKQLGKRPWFWMLIAFASALAASLAIDLNFYFCTTAPGASEVVGVQGRYFLPMFAFSWGAILPMAAETLLDARVKPLWQVRAREITVMGRVSYFLAVIAAAVFVCAIACEMLARYY